MKRARNGAAAAPRKSISAKQRLAGFTAEERSAMKEYIKEMKAGRLGESGDRLAGENAVMTKIAELPEPDRGFAEQLRALVKANAPALAPRTWCGMPAYAKDGNVVCSVQSAKKFKTRYATLGFSDKAKLDDGRMWPIAFAAVDMTPAEVATIVALIKKAVGWRLHWDGARLVSRQERTPRRSLIRY